MAPITSAFRRLLIVRHADGRMEVNERRASAAGSVGAAPKLARVLGEGQNLPEDKRFQRSRAKVAEHC